MYTRRQWFQVLGGMAAASQAGCRVFQDRGPGVISGPPVARQLGAGILQAGGNAVDAAVAAGLACRVTEMLSCGVAGYGGHLTIAEGAQVSAVFQVEEKFDQAQR